ncbi:hypothetical protein COL5a_004986 [Colletotrichum fioriniae]|nr:hypothetical protein COL5a_004986 [Colletotrichum fioriniae]
MRTCVVNNAYYSQCLPGSASASSSAAASSTVRSSSSAVVSPSRTSTTAGAGTTTTRAGTATTSAPAVTGGATYTGNPFAGVNLWANSYYASEITTLAIPSLSPALQTAAAAVAKVPTFMWM